MGARRRRNWIARRLSLRRIILASIVALFIVFVVWVNYPFAPNPVVFFKNTQSKLTIDSGPGSWSVVGRDLRHSRYVEVGPPPPAGNIKWDSFVIEPLNAEPVAQRSNIYLSSANGVYPLAADTGNIREGWEGDTAGRITGAPVVYESYLYFGSTDHTINGWNAFNGDPLWSFTAEDTVEVAPVLSQGLVYVSSGEGWVYALDAVNGALIWSKQLDSNASAAVTVHEGKLLVGDDKGILYILSARTGQEWFRYRTPRAVTGSPVVSSDGERAYFAAGGELYAINARNREIRGCTNSNRSGLNSGYGRCPACPVLKVSRVDSGALPRRTRYWESKAARRWPILPGPDNNWLNRELQNRNCTSAATITTCTP